MTLFRFKGNGLLYTIYRVTPRMVAGQWHEAHPYKHSVDIGGRYRQGCAPARVTFKSNMSLDDFDAVAVC